MPYAVTIVNGNYALAARQQQYAVCSQAVSVLEHHFAVHMQRISDVVHCAVVNFFN